MSLKPICLPCRRFFRPKKNGQCFIEGMPNRDGAPQGTRDPAAWSPYKLWAGDLWACPDCGAEIIVGTPSFPLAEHYEPDFEGTVRTRCGGAEPIQINDC